MLELLLVEDLPAPVHEALRVFAQAMPCERRKKYRDLARLLHESFALDVDEIAWLVRTEKDRDFHSHCR